VIVLANDALISSSQHQKFCDGCSPFHRQGPVLLLDIAFSVFRILLQVIMRS
jgi:hypothetical protein